RGDSYYSYAYAPFKLVASLGRGATRGSLSSPTNAAPIAATLGTPREIFGSASHDLVNGVITLAIVLFIAFPATIFNQAFAENYDEIMLIVSRWRRRVRRLVTGRRTHEPSEESRELAGAVTTMNTEPSMPGRSTSIWFCCTLFVGAFFAGLLNPVFGWNAPSVELIIGTLLAFFVGATVTWLVARSFRRMHGYTTSTYLRALPVGLAVGAVCVVISRTTHFEPGYLYGIVISFAFAGSLKDRHNAHLVAISSLSTLVVGFAAWLLWIPINHRALQQGAKLLTIVADDALATIFVGALVGTVFLLVPLEGLPGGDLSKWRRDAWALVFFIALFLLVAVELRPASGPTHPGSAPVVTVVVLFVLFGGVSLGTRRYFKGNVKRSASVTLDEANRAAANQGGDL
ncbi:MAG: FGLLP motif-containing membrane protein, partial [Acidimicrobiales bacterium]